MRKILEMRFFLILFLREIFSQNIRKLGFLRLIICCKYNKMVKKCGKMGLFGHFHKNGMGDGKDIYISAALG